MGFNSEVRLYTKSQTVAVHLNSARMYVSTLYYVRQKDATDPEKNRNGKVRLVECVPMIENRHHGAAKDASM